MNILNALAVLASIAVLAYLLCLAFGWMMKRPADEQKRLEQRAELRRLCELRAQRMRGEAPAIHVAKKYGPLGVRGFRAADYFRAMKGWCDANIPGRAAMSASMANIGTTFRDHGMKTYYPSDVVPNSSTNPYNSRYILVQQAPNGTTLSATLAPSYTIGSDSICQTVPGAVFVSPGVRVPLGIMTDEVGNSALDQAPFSGDVFLFCGGGRSTMYAIADAVITAGSLLVPSSVTNGYLGPVPAVAGVYWCVGAAGSTSEGAGTGIELYQNLFPVSVDEIT